MKASLPFTNKPRIIIVGAGFGGINLARSLRKANAQVVMIDKNNYHTFQPLLYQVATGGLEPDSIAFPLRKIFGNQENYVFRMAEVERIDPENQSIHTSIGEIDYDYLVLATGTSTNFFGLNSLEKNAVGMKSINESLDLRSLILENFEQALNEKDPLLRNLLMNFVVVGGGPTGVETAGALAELKKHVLPNDYPELDLRQMEIHLIEAGPQLLAGMSEESSDNALKALEDLGVNIWLNTSVKNYDGRLVTTSEGPEFETTTVIWAAGVKGSVLAGINPDVIDQGSRLRVDTFNRVEGYSNVFAIGDLALMRTEAFPDGHPQVAQGAIQQAKNLARNLLVHLNRKEMKYEFTYNDKGSMATIGRNKAVVDLGKIHFRGYFAWLAWMFVHLLFLLGFRNKLVVLVNWIWSYITYDKGNRLIIRSTNQERKREAAFRQRRQEIEKEGRVPVKV